MTDETITIESTLGPVRGTAHDTVARFAGIRYAEPPVGPRRFRAAVDSTTMTQDATEFGPVAPQNPSILEAALGLSPQVWDEDCLSLNVWSPREAVDGSGAARRPVMVWLHGGGFEMGSGSSPIYTGDRFARAGVVLVTLNYRLGPLGFLDLSSLDADYRESGNLGLTDQLSALRWVQRHISAFGGDADNVTVFGQSAGAMSLSLLMVAPAARGLFRNAICQSGSPITCRTPNQAALDTADVMAAAGCTTLDDVLAAPAETLLAAHGSVAASRIADPEDAVKRVGSPMAFLVARPVADGDLLPADPWAAWEAGDTRGISLVTGTTTEEWKLFSFSRPGFTEEAELTQRLTALVDNPADVLDTYRGVHPQASPAELEIEVLSDVIFRMPSLRMSACHAAHSPVHAYLWDWRSPVMGGAIGAAHAVEIPFVFDTIEDHRLHVLVGADAPASLARSVNEAWINTARTGAPAAAGLPEWPEWTLDRRETLLIDEQSIVVDDPGATVRRMWEQ